MSRGKDGTSETGRSALFRMERPSFRGSSVRTRQARGALTYFTISGAANRSSSRSRINRGGKELSPFRSRSASSSQ